MATDDLKEKADLYNKIYGGYIDVTSTENTVANYNKLANDYEKDFVGLGYETPKIIAAEVLKHVQSNDTRILDVACGTGLVGEGLLSCGFTGIIDGIDGSKSMLMLAQKRGIYQNLAEEFIYPNKPMPYEDNQFDAIVCSGGFAPGHLEPEVLEDLIRVVKPNGVIVFASRANEAANIYVQKLDSYIEKLEKENYLKKDSYFTTTYFDYDASSSNKNEIKPLKAGIYVCKKCK